MLDESAFQRPAALLTLPSPLLGLRREFLPRLQVSPNLPSIDFRGNCELNPRSISWLAGLGLYESRHFLKLPGEIIGGHKRRNVARIRLQSADGERIAYLKRDHAISWQDRLRHCFAGYGLSSKCEREARLLQQLEVDGLSAPRWLACGEDGEGKAFLLIEESKGYIPLRRFLHECSDHSKLSEIAKELGRLLAAYHTAGYTMPDLSSKHVLLNEETLECQVIDWQRAVRKSRFDKNAALSALAKLNATLPGKFASRWLRIRLLRAYLTTLSENSPRLDPKKVDPLSKRNMKEIARKIQGETTILLQKRSIQKERNLVPNAPEQKLVWLDGEAICVVPELMQDWPADKTREVAYGDRKEESFMLGSRKVRIVRERKKHLLPRFLLSERHKRAVRPMKLARRLFEAERQGNETARLLAFGIRAGGIRTTESFVLFEEKPKREES